MRRKTSLPVSTAGGGSGPLMARSSTFHTGAPPSPLNTFPIKGSGSFRVNGLMAEGVGVGILHKWVNIGRGWKQRLFILEQGVLSYYTLEGPNRVTIAKELQKRPGAKTIGEETHKIAKKEKANAVVNGDTTQRRPLGEVHLQVSSVRASESDERKFYIFSGTKTLHLKADSKEDRQIWLDILQSVKDRFLLSPPALEVPPIEPVHVSTAPLRQRLQEAGLGEEVIRECEEIVQTQVCGALATDLQEERQRKQRLLVRLSQLEVEKQQLETQVVQESMYLQGERTQEAKQAAEGEDESEEHMDSHETEDDEEDFFEAPEDFTQSRKRGPDVVAPLTPPNPDPEADVLHAGPSKELLDMALVGHSYPRVVRRDRLPEPQEKEKPASLWSIIKDNVGKDLSHICLPVYFNEPISTLQKCFEEMEYSGLVDKAHEWGRRGNQLMRALHVAAFAMSAYSCTAGRSNKPFNPLLGETFEAAWEDKGCRFLAEKVSHHPNIVACHCEGQGWTFWGDSNLKNKFWGPSITLEPTGVLSLKFDDGELYEWTKVTTGIYNIILGKPYVDHYGTMKITGNRGMSIALNFKQPSIMDRHPHQVRGFVKNDKTGEKLATLIGKWDQSIHYVLGDLSKKQLKEDAVRLPNAVELWRRGPPSKFPTRYNLTSFAITLNELTPGLKELLPPTDARLRPDQRALENGLYDYANEEKLRLEQRQRQARKQQEAGWNPRWFQQTGPHGTWSYQGGYWERRAKRDWSGVPNIYAMPDLKPEEQKGSVTA